MPPMKSVAFWLWMIPSETRPGKLVKTQHRMTEEQARQRHGAAARRVDGSCELRQVPETDADLEALKPGAGPAR